ncbi:MAG: hypothetical protein VYA69_09355 [Gemmatimonadota bacterium]|nr:hypothetical protein [Gemmatimonadota bacterium]
MPRILSHEQMQSLLNMDDVIDTVENGFRSCTDQSFNTPVRLPLDVPDQNAVILYMPAYLSDPKTLGAKVVSVFPDNTMRDLPVIMGTYLLHDAESGELNAIMDATYMTGIRTAATSAVATKYLANENVRTLGIVGAGVQARYHVEALCCVRSFERILVYNRTIENGKVFVERMAKSCPVPIELVNQTNDIAVTADVIATCTRSKEPVLDGRRLKSGVHINAVGAFSPEMRELDEYTILNSRVIVDTYGGALTEAGDLLIPMNSGTLTRQDIHAELSEVVSGLKPNRQSNDEITVFKSVGFAMEDAVTAHLAYQRALASGVGTDVEL